MRKISKMSFAAIIVLFIVVLLVNIGLVSAHEHDFTEIKQLIDSGTACNQLADEQLEAIGDYYMEQIHPGEAHELMDNMMGGEGSASLKQVHINMAKRLYCNEESTGMMGNGMMGMMNMMRGGGNMMGTNMMGGSFGGGSLWLWSIVGMLFWIAMLVTLVLLIIWLYKTVTGQAANGNSALGILKKRFAKGEISKKEFESMKREIR